MEMLIVLFLLLFCGILFVDFLVEYNGKVILDGDFKYNVYWIYNVIIDMMYIVIEVKVIGWVVLVFIKEKSFNMKDYDVCLGFVIGSIKVLNVSC